MAVCGEKRFKVETLNFINGSDTRRATRPFSFRMTKPQRGWSLGSLSRCYVVAGKSITQVSSCWLRSTLGSAYDELSRQLQAHLLEVTRGYWALYLERVSLAQKVKLYLQTEKITEHLERRQQIDAQRSQLASAQAALESRRSDLIRARTAIKNAETRLRTLLNHS